jgi:hypothetical protein
VLPARAGGGEYAPPPQIDGRQIHGEKRHRCADIEQEELHDPASAIREEAV